MPEAKKKQEKTANNYVRSFRRGAIAANVFRRQSPGGFEYLDFSLSRSWKTKQSGKEGYSSNFFDRNAQDLKEAIDDAAAFIRAQMQNDELPEGRAEEMPVGPPVSKAA